MYISSFFLFGTEGERGDRREKGGVKTQVDVDDREMYHAYRLHASCACTDLKINMEYFSGNAFT